MKDEEMYYGFSKEKQAEYEKQIIERFGEQGKAHTEESKRNVKNWSKADWDDSGKEFDAICKELTVLLQKKCKSHSKEVLSVIGRHYKWLKRFWTPTKESYAGHGQFIEESELRKAYEAYHPQLLNSSPKQSNLLQKKNCRNSLAAGLFRLLFFKSS